MVSDDQRRPEKEPGPDGVGDALVARRTLPVAFRRKNPVENQVRAEEIGGAGENARGHRDDGK